MADDSEKTERTTSAAKHLQPDALSRARSLKQEFDRAKSGQEKTTEREQPNAAERRHAPVPAPSPKPNLPGTKTVDDNAFKERQAKEDSLSRARSYKLDMDRATRPDMLDKNRDRNDEKDRDK